MNPDKKSPNFLIVMTDHQRWDTVLPEHPCITPNLTEFAKNGITLNQVYCPTAHCCPARATFHSGLYPSRHGVWNNVNNAYAVNHGPHRHIKMFSEDLRENGYELAYCGKWHVSALADQTPENYGWTELQKYGGTLQNTSEKWERIRKTADQPDPPDVKIKMPGYNHHDLYGETQGIGKGDARTLKLGLDALPKLAAGSKPWALFIGWNAPHAPYKVQKKYLDMYPPEDVPLPDSFADEMADKPDYYGKLRRMVFDQLGEEGVREGLRHFWAMCTQLDEMFGEVLDALDATGQAEDTVVLYCSDHGDYAGDHGLFHKQVPAFLGAYRVPAILRWPRGLKDPGRRIEKLVSLADFAPTFLELAGISRDRYFTGSSLVPFLNNDTTPPDWRQEICTQCEGTENYFTQRQIITADYKYVYNGFGMDEFYDLRHDPDEMINLIADPDKRDILRDLVGRMWRFAYLEQDRLGATQYIMVNTAPWGPKEGLRGEKGKKLPSAVPLGSENDPKALRKYITTKPDPNT